MLDWETINIKRARKNGLKAVAAREGRSAIKQLDWILRNAGVEELSDVALQKELKAVKKEGEEIPVVSRK